MNRAKNKKLSNSDVAIQPHIMGNNGINNMGGVNNNVSDKFENNNEEGKINGGREDKDEEKQVNVKNISKVAKGEKKKRDDNDYEENIDTNKVVEKEGVRMKKNNIKKK